MSIPSLPESPAPVDASDPERRGRRPKKERLVRRLWGPAVVGGYVVLATSCEEVSVTAVEVASVTLTPVEGTIEQGDTLRLRAVLHDASGNSLADRPVEWSVDRPEVAGLETDGLVRGLTEGTATVRASSEGVMAEASVTVTRRPAIALSTTELDLQGRAGGTSTDPLSVEISNGGGGSLAGLRLSVVHPEGEPAGWLEAALVETSAPTVLLVWGSPEGLAPGQYRPQVRVSSDQAANSPQVIDVSFEVREQAPAIEVSPKALGFAVSEGQGVPAPETVSVTNAGGGELTDLEVSISYMDGEPTAWLDAELAGSAAPTHLTVRVDPERLEPPAALDAVVEITSPAAPGAAGVVHVRLQLGEPPPPPESRPCAELARIRDDLKAIEDASPGSRLADKIEDVRHRTEAAYTERCVKSPPDRPAAAADVEGAVGDVDSAVRDRLISTSQGVDLMDRLVSVSRDMAVEAIEAAEARGGRWIDRFWASRLLWQGDSLRSGGRFREAAARYRSAISMAEGA